MFIRSKVFILFCLSILTAFPGFVLAEMTVGNYKLVSTQRVTRTEYSYTYQAEVINTGPNVKNVTATLTSSSPHTTVIDNSLNFGDVSSGQTVASSDQFIIKQDRLYPFDQSSLVWNIQYSPTTILVSGKAIAGLPVVGTINIRDSSNPVKTSFSAINSDGSYTLAIDSSWTPPFLMWAEGWVNNKHLRLLSSFDLKEGQTELNVNTTPATNAIMESAMGVKAAEINPLAVIIPTPGFVDQIRKTVEETLVNIFAVIGMPPNFNLFESPIGDVGSPTDQMFDMLNFDVNDQDSIVVSAVTDNTQQVVIDPSQTAGIVPSEMVTKIGETDDALTQIRNILVNYYALYQDPNVLPDFSQLKAEFEPNLAPGYLNSAYNIDDKIAALATYGDTDGSASTFVGCSIFRPMKTQYYGNQQVEEIPDAYTEGFWVLTTSSYGGKQMTGYTAFVNIGNNTWKWYGNRRPFREEGRGRPRSRQLMYPAGGVTYLQGLNFRYDDVGDKALDLGITNLAIFNPAFAPETIDGVNTNCVRLERRDGGLSTSYRLFNVPHYWAQDDLYQISKEDGDRLIDFDNLKSQTAIEFVAIGLDENDHALRTWIYTIPEAPESLDAIMTNPDQYFASIDPDTISFTPYDDNSPDNADAFPGNEGLFSWTFPNDPNLFPSWGWLGWNDFNGYWNGFGIDNPAYYAIGDLYAWTSDYFNPGPTAYAPRYAEFSISMRDTNQREYVLNKRWDPWSEDIYSFENGALAINLSETFSPDKRSTRLQTQLEIHNKNVTRFETKVKVIGGSFIDANPGVSSPLRALTRIELVFQPEKFYLEGLPTGYLQVVVAIWVEEDGRRWIQGDIWLANDNDWNLTKGETWPGKVEPGKTETDFPGNFPSGELLAENEETATYHTIAVEQDKANGKIIVEYDGQRSAFDMSNIPGFNSDDFQFARIRTRVTGINEPGDEGSIQVRYEDVRVNNEAYDNFENGFGVNKWYISTNE